MDFKIKLNKIGPQIREEIILKGRRYRSSKSFKNQGKNLSLSAWINFDYMSNINLPC